MKQCPKCGTTYSDESLSFCLSDGTTLAEVGEQPTVVRSGGAGQAAFGGGGPMRVEIPSDEPTGFAPSPQPAPSGGSWLKYAVILVILGVLVVGAMGLAGGLIYFNRNSQKETPNNTVTNANNSSTANNSNSNHSSPTPNSTTSNANTEDDQLRNQVANLEKRLDEQKNTNKPATNIPALPNQPTLGGGVARVNSPEDGFLALRTLPSSDYGERILAIPNGAAVAVNGCLARSRLGNRSGRWCRVTYNGYTGWAFDAWLIH